MGAVPKCQTRIQLDRMDRLRRCLVPGGHDPENPVVISDRRKLRLGQAHPVLFGHFLPAHHRALGKRSPAPATGRLPLGLGVPSWNKASTLERFQPSWVGAFRFAKQSLLGIGMGIGILDADAQCIQRIQCVVGHLPHDPAGTAN